MPAKNTTPQQPANPLPAGTRVLNTTDGQPGTVLNPYAWNAAGWTEYEVETANAIEIWKTADFILMSEAEQAARDNA